MSADKLTERDDVKKWAEKHDARPMRVKDTEQSGDGIGVLRLSTGQDDDRLEEIGWDDWLDAFEEAELALLAEDTDKGPFHKLVSR